MKKMNSILLSIWCILAPCLVNAFVGSGGQDAGNGGGFVVYENETIFYDFHYEDNVLNPTNWQDLAGYIENNILMQIDSFGGSSVHDSIIQRTIYMNSQSEVLSERVLSLVFYYLDRIKRVDSNLADELKSVFRKMRWLDAHGDFALVPYCTLRMNANWSRGFNGANDNNELDNRCDVYPVAYNLTDFVLINTKFFSTYNVTNIDLVGLVIHEILQTYVTLLNYRDHFQRFFLSKIVKTLIIYDRPSEAVEMLKYEVR